jgi:hypothetical protein
MHTILSRLLISLQKKDEPMNSMKDLNGVREYYYEKMKTGLKITQKYLISGQNL